MRVGLRRDATGGDGELLYVTVGFGEDLRAVAEVGRA